MLTEQDTIKLLLLLSLIILYILLKIKYLYNQHIKHPDLRITFEPYVVWVGIHVIIIAVFIPFWKYF